MKIYQLIQIRKFSRKLFLIFLNNAIKFTEKGSISFGYNILKGEVEFFVKDTGIGIGKESLEQYF